MLSFNLHKWASYETSNHKKNGEISVDSRVTHRMT